jgi:hypothetical protein
VGSADPTSKQKGDEMHGVSARDRLVENVTPMQGAT